MSSYGDAGRLPHCWAGWRSKATADNDGQGQQTQVTASHRQFGTSHGSIDVRIESDHWSGKYDAVVEKKGKSRGDVCVYVIIVIVN